MAALLLLAFTVQSYVAQTHIHDIAATVGQTIHQSSVGGPHGKLPVDNAPVDCAFCQAVAHAGSFLLPATSLLILSTVWTELASPRLFAPVASADGAHSWQSRAPPHI